MKIKTKKQLNLPQLIEHIVKNDYEFARYKTDNKSAAVQVSPMQGITIDKVVYRNETFTVEAEEEITEDTVMPNLLEVCSNHFDNIFTDYYKNKSIKEIKDDDWKAQVFYILNDDYTMTLIWRNGKLVE